MTQIANWDGLPVQSTATVFQPEHNPFKILFADITHRCNMACRNCYLPNRTIPDMDAQWLRGILERLPNRTRIRLVGAEPHARDDCTHNIAVGPTALLQIRRALERGRAVVAMLDEGRQSRQSVAVHPNLTEIAIRTGAPIIVYRADVDPREPVIRILTRIGWAPGSSPENRRRQTREAVEELYGADWSLQLQWPRSFSDDWPERAAKGSARHDI